jgi:hypothetical protein
MDGIGERNVIAQGETVLSGQYLVEQVRADDRMVRCLYFMENPLVIQSELALSLSSDSSFALHGKSRRQSLRVCVWQMSRCRAKTLRHVPPGCPLLLALAGDGDTNFQRPVRQQRCKPG